MMLWQEITPHLMRCLWFIPELILADLLYWSTFDRKRLFPLRFVSFLLLLFVSLPVIFYATRGSLWNNILSFIVALLLSIVMGKFCFDITWLDAAFCATVGYNTQFIGSITSEFFQRVFGMPRWPHEAPIVLAVYVALYFLFGRQLKKGQNLDINKLVQFLLLIAAVLTDIVICGMLRRFWLVPENRPFTIGSMILLFISSYAILALQFSLLSRKTLANELEVVRQVWKREQSQYQFSKETIDSINRKCHDMRHQIRTIGSQANINPEAISEMAHAIDIFDSLYRTGSSALDTILAEKTLYCRENHISINCMADGKKLSFMSDTDIYSLFGNILENSILAVMKLPESERDIFLSIVAKDELLSINVRNPYTGVITMKDGLPVTTNADTASHGFGTRSTRMIVESYGGTVTFVPKNGEFTVLALFPLEGNTPR